MILVSINFPQALSDRVHNHSPLKLFNSTKACHPHPREFYESAIPQRPPPLISDLNGTKHVIELNLHGVCSLF